MGWENARPVKTAERKIDLRVERNVKEEEKGVRTEHNQITDQGIRNKIEILYHRQG